MRPQYDVVIAGGGVVGSSCAYHLKLRLDFPGSVLVVEPDPTYRDAASTRSASSIRLQFSTPINIAIVRLRTRVSARCAARACGGAGAADLGLVASTYLYLATPRGRPSLEERAAIQRAHSVPVTLHDPAELASRYPWLNTADLAARMRYRARGKAGSTGMRCSPSLRAAAQAAGARYVRDRVDRLRTLAATDRIAAVVLERARRGELWIRGERGGHEVGRSGGRRRHRSCRCARASAMSSCSPARRRSRLVRWWWIPRVCGFARSGIDSSADHPPIRIPTWRRMISRSMYALFESRHGRRSRIACRPSRPFA